MYPNGGTPPEEELAKHGDTSDLGEEGEGTMEEEGEMEGEGIMEEDIIRYRSSSQGQSGSGDCD